MLEIKSIIAKYNQLKSSELRMALAIVTHVEDSSYRRSGARMLITEDGKWVGGISGGCLEGDTLKKAQYAIRENKTVKVVYDTREDDPNQIGVGLGCNGLIEVLITPLNLQEDPSIELLKKCLGNRDANILITDLKSGKVHRADELNPRLSNLRPAIKAVIQQQQSTKTGSGFFIEFIPPPIALYIFGQNYDVIPLATIAASIGWHTHIIGNPTTVPKPLYELCTSIIDRKKYSFDFDQYSAALLMSHDYHTDKSNLRLLATLSLPYLGVLGPKKRSIKMLKELKEQEVILDLDHINSPMGLDTGATSPSEIAISIIAEIRTCFSRREGGKLKNRPGPINN